MKNKGFTLIELLVVIAIIGILSSVVLASLNSARAKGADAAVKSNLANIRPQAEIYYDGVGNGKYGTTGTVGGASCASAAATTLFTDSTVAAQIEAAKDASGTTLEAACGNDATTNPQSWAVVVPLKSTTSKAWCVDATGVAKEVDNGGTAYTQTTLNAEILSSGKCGA